MLQDIWTHIIIAIIFIGKTIFTQWYKITTGMISLDLRLTKVEKSLAELRGKPSINSLSIQEELTSTKALLEEIAKPNRH